MPDPNTASLAPMLSVRRGFKAVEFYKAAFDAVEVSRIESADGELVAKLTIGASEFWVADESPDHGNFSPETLNGTTVRMVLTVNDPDATHAQAIRAGAIQVSPVKDQPYGWRVGRLTDPFGHAWEIGKPLAAPSQG